MRKQDRIANQEQQKRSDDLNRKDSQNQSQAMEREQMKGSAAETPRPPRQAGKLPLPD